MLASGTTTSSTIGRFTACTQVNVVFDGGGRIPVLEETNDIGFQAVRVTESGSVQAGIYFRLALGGITGHKDIARDTGVPLAPARWSSSRT